jgi:hypothetical protein
MRIEGVPCSLLSSVLRIVLKARPPMFWNICNISNILLDRQNLLY